MTMVAPFPNLDQWREAFPPECSHPETHVVSHVVVLCCKCGALLGYELGKGGL